MEFKIYAGGPGNVTGDTGGTLLWTEDWVYGTGSPDNRVVVKNGYYSVQLGSVTALPSAVTLDQSTLWLSMNVENTSGATSQCTGFSSGSPAACTGGDGEMLPMKSLSAAPFAIDSASTNQVNSYGLSNNFMDLAAPSGISAVNGGAGVVPGTVCYAVTATNASGETIAANNSGTVTPGGTHAVTVSWSAVNGATGYKIYRNSSCSFTSGSLLDATISSGITTSYSDNAASTSAGLPPTSVTGTTATIQGWSGQTANLLQAQNAAGGNVATIDNNGDFVAVGTVNTDTLGANVLTFSGNTPAISGPATATSLSIDSGSATANINIGGGTSQDINLAGGSGSTGCTITNSNGNLTCAGNITGPTNGTVGYWTQSGGNTLQPSTSSWTISSTGAITTSGNISTSGSGTITSAGLLTASAGLTVAANQNITMTSGTGTYTQTSSSPTNVAQTITGGTSLTTGGDENNTGTYVHTTAETGSLESLTAKDSSTNASGATTTNGVSVGTTINTSGAGTKTINEFNANAATLTGCASGACTVNGYNVTTQSTGAAATITQNALNINAVGVTAGALNGINISGITGGGGTETAINLGSGWDNLIQGTTAGTNLFSFTNFTVASGGAVTAGNYNGITIGTTVQPGSAGAFKVSSNGANTMTLDTGGGAAIDLGPTNATSIILGGNTSATITEKIANSSTTAYRLQSAGGTNYLTVDTSGNNITIGNGTSNITLSGPVTTITAVNPVSGGAEAWHNITYASGWTTGSNGNAVAYRMLPDGNVQLTGQAVHAGFTTQTALSGAALPAAYTPAHQEELYAPDTVNGYIIIGTAGNLYAVPSSATVTATGVDINGIYDPNR